MKITFWKEPGGFYLGYLDDYPDHWTQGENLADLKEQLRDLFQMFSAEEVSGIRKEKEISERLRLSGGICDSISAHPDTMTLAEAQQEELDRRLEDCRLHLDDAEPWESVRQEILNDL